MIDGSDLGRPSASPAPTRARVRVRARCDGAPLDGRLGRMLHQDWTSVFQMPRSERVVSKTPQTAPLRAVEDGIDANRLLHGFWGALVRSW